MKKKNPLYVVKGKDVEEAGSMLDLVVKKFNLGPLISVLKNIMDLLLKGIQNYALLSVVKIWIDDLIKLIGLISPGLRFSL